MPKLSLMLSLLVAAIAIVGVRLFASISPSAVAVDVRTNLDPYRGQWAIVAGASEGLGAAWAETLCAHRVHVLLLARREEKLQRLATHLRTKYSDTNVQVEYRVHDLAQPQQEAAFQEMLATGDREYALLIYNAAYSPIGHFATNPLEEAYATVDLNVRGVLGAAHSFVNHRLTERKNRGGALVLMSSLTGISGTGIAATYAATKAWNTAFARGLHYELKPRGLDVLACVAGATSTPNYLKTMTKRYTGDGDASAAAQEGDDHHDGGMVSLPTTVVEGCLADLGIQSTSFPGVKNKIFGWLLSMVLPTDLAVRLSSETMEAAIADADEGNQ